MNVQGTTATGYCNEMLRAMIHGISAAKIKKIKNKIQDANFMKIIPYPGNVTRSIFPVVGNSAMLCG